MNFFDQQQERYEKALKFFNDPNISQGRKDLKQQEFKELEAFVNAEIYFSEKLNLKFKQVGRKIIFETGTIFDIKDIDKMVKMSKEGVLRIYKLFTIFKNASIMN